jgi:hypothetical protein
LVNGALLLLKHLDDHNGRFGFVPAALAAAVASAAYLTGVQRQRTLERCPLPRHITPSWEVHLIGAAVLALIVVVVLTFFV